MTRQNFWRRSHAAWLGGALALGLGVAGLAAGPVADLVAGLLRGIGVQKNLWPVRAGLLPW